jgi:hypothetical protein
MFRAMTIALIAMAAFDYVFYNGWYTHTAEAVAVNALRILAG